MNVRKHLAGFAIFSVIVGCAIFINHFLTGRTTANIPVIIHKEESVEPNVASPRVNYQVEQVTLDFDSRRIYTQLSVLPQLNQHWPENLWVTTLYFSPGYSPGKVWTTTIEVPAPFARQRQIGLVTAHECEPCHFSVPRGVGFFARVYVSTERPGKDSFAGAQSDLDITAAVPVVVHWPDDKQSDNSLEKFVRHEYLIY
jgi:hypothetical protein